MKLVHTQPRSGRLVYVVGASGAGKDSLIAFAKAQLAGDESVRFVQRTITRPPSIGEDHIAVTVDHFETLVRSSAFALYWCAHGLSYGLPADMIGWVAAGMTAVVNGSRAALPTAIKLFPDIVVANVTADPAMIAMRLEGRNREDAVGRQARLDRRTPETLFLDNAICLDNSGDLHVAGVALVEILRRST